jgi:hypothetical protein
MVRVARLQQNASAVQESRLRAPRIMRITLLNLACSRLPQHPRATERIPNGCIQQLYVEDKYHSCEKSE